MGSPRKELVDAIAEPKSANAWLKEMRKQLQRIAASGEALNLADVRDKTMRFLIHQMSLDSEDEMTPLRYCQELARIAGWYQARDARKEQPEALSPEQANDWAKQVAEFRAKAS